MWVLSSQSCNAPQSISLLQTLFEMLVDVFSETFAQYELCEPNSPKHPLRHSPHEKSTEEHPSRFNLSQPVTPEQFTLFKKDPIRFITEGDEIESMSWLDMKVARAAESIGITVISTVRLANAASESNTCVVQLTEFNTDAGLEGREELQLDAKEFWRTTRFNPLAKSM